MDIDERSLEHVPVEFVRMRAVIASKATDVPFVVLEGHDGDVHWQLALLHEVHDLSEQLLIHRGVALKSEQGNRVVFVESDAAIEAEVEA